MKNPFLKHLIKAIAFVIFLQAFPALAKDELTIGISQFPATLNPNLDSMLAKTYIMAMTERPFTAFGPDWKPLCMLCTDLPSLEKGTAKIETGKDGKPGIAATYTIQKDATWGDGVLITTKDVVFTWETGKHPQSGFSNAEMFSKDIADITVIDDKTFILHFSKVFCDFASIDDFHLLPAHLEKKVFDANPVNYRNATLYNTDPTNSGLYFGPYKIIKVEPGVSVILEPNATWWGKKPFFKKITVKAIENTAALSANLLAGDIDYIAGELGLLVDQGLSLEERLTKTRAGEYDVIYKPSLVFEHMDVNLDNPPLDDVKVRKALLLATDRKTMTEILFGGHQPVADSMVNPLDEFFASDVTLYPYAPAKAASLLDEAGWKIKEDGWRYNAKGQKLSVQLLSTAGNKTRELVEQAIASDWKKSGIEGRIENETPRIFFGDTTGKRQFKNTAMYAWMSAPRNIPKTTMHSSMIPTEKNNWSGQNYPGFKNPRTDAVIESLETTCDLDPRRKLWAELQKIYSDELPSLPLYYRADVFFIPKWLKGIEPTGHMHPSTYWIENWSAQP